MKVARCVVMAVAVATVVLWWRMPIFTGALTKQTIFVALADALSWHDATEATLMWIDDDSGDGVMAVKRISDDLGLKATFAVIPQRMTDRVADSLRAWQQEGFGIALHGLNHASWREWSERLVEADIRESRRTLAQRGFDTLKLSPIVVPPYGVNTKAVRGVLRRQELVMVTGAHVVNPSSELPYWGRLWVDGSTNLDAVRQMLQQVARRGGLVVIGTHSSDDAEFSEAKVRAVLLIAKELGLRME